LDPETIIFLQPCKGETPGNVLGINEEADSKIRVEGFIGKLKDSDPKTRACAARQLGYLGKDATLALPILLTLFREDPNDGVRTNAKDALWKIGPNPKITLEEHIELTNNPDVYVRLYAAFALGYFKPPFFHEKDVIGALTLAVKDQDNTVRWMALTGLARMGSIAGTAVPFLIELMDDKAPGIRSAAIRALGNIGPDAARAAPALLTRLFHPVDYGEYLEAATALSEIGPIILPLLESEMNRHATAVLTVLRDMGPAGTPLILKALEIPDKAVQKEAIKVAGTRGAEVVSAVPLIAKALDDPDTEIRQVALYALKDLGPLAQAAIPALREKLANKDDWVVCDSALALGAIGASARTAVPQLLQIMRRPIHILNDMPQRCAAEALIVMGPETKTLVPAGMKKRVSDWYRLMGVSPLSPLFAPDPTQPKPLKKPMPVRIT
jgi:HEAT repeat protein